VPPPEEGFFVEKRGALRRPAVWPRPGGVEPPATEPRFDVAQRGELVEPPPEPLAQEDEPVEPE
jgi:hypothetical protein